MSKLNWIDHSVPAPGGHLERVMDTCAAGAKDRGPSQRYGAHRRQWRRPRTQSSAYGGWRKAAEGGPAGRSLGALVVIGAAGCSLCAGAPHDGRQRRRASSVAQSAFAVLDQGCFTPHWRATEV